MATITTGNHPAALWPGVHAWFGAKYDEHETEYTELFDVKDSNKNYEEDTEQTGFGLAPIKPEGAPVAFDQHQQGFTKRYRHIAFGLGYIVTREERDDNLYEKVSMDRAGSLAFSMSQTKENFGANFYNRAFNTSYPMGDGKPILAADHPSLGADQSNVLGTAAQLSEAAIEDLCIDIMDAKNSRSLQISLRPTKLLVSTAEIFNAERILKSTLQNDTANNAINALRSKGAIPAVGVNHYFTDSNNWFVRTNAPNGMCWFNRVSTEFTKDNDFDTDNAKAKAYMRHSAGSTDWRGLFGSAPA
jgi:hypothetical protein